MEFNIIPNYTARDIQIKRYRETVKIPVFLSYLLKPLRLEFYLLSLNFPLSINLFNFVIKNNFLLIEIEINFNNLIEFQKRKKIVTEK